MLRPCRTTLAAVLLAAPLSSDGFAQQTHPQEYTTITEESPGGNSLSLLNRGIKHEIDRGSDLIIEFNETTIRSIVGSLPVDERITIRVEASIRKGDGTPTLVPIDNYLTA